jgi:hypothetical protein
MTGMGYSAEQWDQATQMLEAGHELDAIKARTGIPKRRLLAKLIYQTQATGQIVRYRDPHPRMTLEEEAKLFASLPKDTRDFTARIMGDPLPGRSALDRRA